MKLLFNVIDKNDILEVEGVCTNENLLTLDKNPVYQIFSWDLFEYIVTKINEGYKVFIPKNLNHPLTINDLIIEDEENVDNLEREKRIAILKARDVIMTTRLTIDKLSYFDLYEMMMLNTWFASKGFYITEDNKEEKYIEILEYATSVEEENSDEIIDKLDKYLSVMNSIQEQKEYYYSYLQFVDSIEEASTKEEVQNLLTNFLSNYN